MDDQRYVGRDVELVFSDAPTAEELEQVEGWAEKIQQLSGPHKVILVSMGPRDNRQLQELMQHLLVEDEPSIRMAPTRCGQSAVFLEAPSWAGTEPTRVRGSYYAPGHVKGKGQRKGNRRDRWR